ncbi:MAG: hypothetical protein QXW09_05695 [Thermoproteota archaeon]
MLMKASSRSLKKDKFKHEEVVSKNVATALEIMCIILIAGLFLVADSYVAIINDKDKAIYSLTDQITHLQNQVDLLNKIYQEFNLTDYWRVIASDLESKGKYAEALDAYHRIIDTAIGTTNQSRFWAIENIRRLNKIVPANANPDLANEFHAILYIFKYVDVRLSGGERVSYSLSYEEIDHIIHQFNLVSTQIFQLSRGQVNIKLDVRIVNVTLTKITEGGPSKMNWLKEDDPAVTWALDDFFNSYKKYFLCFMVWYPKAPLAPVIYGDAYENYIYIAYYPDGWSDDFFREIIVHEWLHSVEMMLARIGYPDGLVPSPDGGRDEGYSGNEPGVDPDYRRPLGETTWFGYYQHIMQEHITPRMWKALATEYVRPRKEL